MANDEALALYGSVKRIAEAMTAREEVLNEQMVELDTKTAALDAKIAAFDAVIAELKQLPRALGQQTSQYIATGVRQAIHDDFTLPIEAAVRGPMAELYHAGQEARMAIGEIRSESKFQSWTWVAIVVLLGTVLGVFGSYFFYNRQLGQLNDRLDSIQQQMLPPAPAVDAKPLDAKPAKGKRGH